MLYCYTSELVLSWATRQHFEVRCEWHSYRCEGKHTRPAMCMAHTDCTTYKEHTKRRFCLLEARPGVWGSRLMDTDMSMEVQVNADISTCCVSICVAWSLESVAESNSLLKHQAIDWTSGVLGCAVAPQRLYAAGSLRTCVVGSEAVSRSPSQSSWESLVGRCCRWARATQAPAVVACCHVNSAFA